MRALRYVIFVVSVLLTVVKISAQERTLLSRAALDSLVRPALSNVASGTLTATEPTLNLGTIRDDDERVVSFLLHNNTEKDIVISNIRSTCSCLKITKQITQLSAHSNATVEAKFNPQGRDGKFNIDILVYTTLDTKLPTERLSITGSVETTNALQHLPVKIGKLHLSRRDVTLSSDTRSERIVCFNGSNKPVTITAHPTIEGLTLHCEPATIEPDKEGDIVIRYCGNMPKHEIRSVIMLEGVTATVAERMIRITIKE